MYTPKVEDHSRLSGKLRHALSIDNISFIGCATNDENNKVSTNHNNNNIISGNDKRDMSKNNSTENLDRIESKSPTQINGHHNSNSNSNNTSSNGNSNNYSSSNGRSHDDEQENIIPWRAQLRKTNSRLSLVG